VKDITEIEFADLCDAIKRVMRTSYESGGATIASYQSFDDQPGSYTQKMVVYGQKHDPEGNPVIKEKTDDGRSTHWVPEVQT
jgi:formamidopyrimidine-DNA glycosylase